MRIGTARTSAGPRPVVLTPTGLHALAAIDTVEQAIGSTRQWEIGERLPDEIPLAGPLAPGKIVAVGLNYRSHLKETNAQEPTAPLLFAKFPSVVIGHAQPIVIDAAATERVDWEVELAVVIGQRARHVAPNDALKYVFGYTIANDVSARDVQFADGQWIRGKNFETFCPLGPFIVTADEIPDPQNLTLRTRVNGATMQSSTTEDMIFGVAEIIAYTSRFFTLLPGDVILTGTPAGCGEFMSPRRSLLPGDIVEVEIERIGVLRNPVVGTS
jgi:2-keto-4-pentenoate hydratase/2-oxohepta-3-ene-1,7-dioic acid hydratase in catechol pathway